MTTNELKKQVESLRAQTQKSINNTYIWATIAASALERSIQDAQFVKKLRFDVPSRKRTKEIYRRPTQVKEFLHHAAERDLFSSVFVFLVAQVEAFMVAMCTRVLSYDTRRLKTPIQGIDRPNKVEKSEIIDAASYDALIEGLIEREMQAVFYAKPKAYFKYLDQVIGVTFEKSLTNEWIEIKAARDILVHNSGIINDTYLQKTGTEARGPLGAVIPFDVDYFERSIATMKAVVGKSEACIRKGIKPTK